MVRDLETTYNYPIVANIRIGEKDGKRLKGLNYFTLHKDSKTNNNIVEYLKKTLGDEPKEIIIKFLSDEPYDEAYYRYKKSGLWCKGDGKKANFRNENNWNECECSKDCSYRENNECNQIGKLYFVIKDEELGGICCFQTKSHYSMNNIKKTLAYCRAMNIDIKEKYFRLSVEEQTNIKMQKYNVIKLSLDLSKKVQKTLENEEKNENINSDIVKKTSKQSKENLDNVGKCEEESKKGQVVDNKPKKKLECEKETDNIKTDVSQKDSEQSKEKSENISSRENHEKESREEQIDNNENIVILYDLHDLTKGEKVVKEANFCNMNDELITVLIHPSIVDEVNKWQESSAIIPTIEKQGKYNVLTGYKDVGILKKAI